MRRTAVHAGGMRTALAIALAGLALAGCRKESPDSAYRAIGPDAAALRAAFNADTGRVRLVVLVSPS